MCKADHCFRCGHKGIKYKLVPRGLLPVNDGVPARLECVEVYHKGSRIPTEFAAEPFWHWKWICHDCGKTTFVDPDCRHGYMECGWCCYAYGEWWKPRGQMAVDDGVYV
jgi:hypothetical protein